MSCPSIFRLTLLTALIGFAAEARADRIKLSSNGDKCLHKEDDNYNNGNDIHLWDCDAGPVANKSWYLDTSTGYIHSSENTSKCLHKQYDNTNNGNPIHLWDCSAGSASNKQWVYDASTGYIKLKANTAKCMHKKYDNTDNGNPIHLWDCSAGSTSNKSWTFDPIEPASIDYTQTSLCTNNTTNTSAYITNSNSFGNSTVGASYSVQAGILETSTSMWVGGKASANGTLFSNTRSMLNIEASAGQSNGSSYSTALLQVVGVTILDDDIGTSLDWSTDQTFFTASASFYGVTVRGELVGTLGFEASAAIAGTGVAVNATPFAEVTADASAGVGGWCISAGAGVDLTVIGVAVPVEGQALIVGSEIAWSIDADLELSTVDGSLYLYVDYCVDEETYTIFSWNGYETTIGLASASGCL